MNYWPLKDFVYVQTAGRLLYASKLLGIFQRVIYAVNLSVCLLGVSSSDPEAGDRLHTTDDVQKCISSERYRKHPEAESLPSAARHVLQWYLLTF